MSSDPHTISSRLLLLLTLVVCNAFAVEDLWKESFQVHGFASQAYISTSDNNFFGESEDDGTFDFRELGVNASLRPTPKLQLAAQILSRRAGEGDDGDLRLDYGLADYSFITEADTALGLRAGRVKLPLGLYNDTRDVAFTRPSIFLPQSIYFDRTRNLSLSADGLEVYGERRTAVGDFTLQIKVGRPRADESDVEVNLLGGERPGELEGQTSVLGRILYEQSGGAIRLALTGTSFAIDYDPGPNDPLAAGSIDIDFVVLSGQYNAERWSLTSEFATRRFDFEDNFEAIGIPGDSFTGESYYLQGTYRLSDKWEGVLRYDVLFTDRDDRNGRDFEIRTGRPDYTRFAKDWTVGLRWDLTPAIMLRAEFHSVNGTAWLPLEDNPDALEQHWEMFSLLASFRF